MNNNILAQTLGINNDENDIISGELVDKKTQYENKQAEDDIALVRENLHDLLSTAQEAISELKLLADASQNPRAYEILGNFIKQAVESNKMLVDIHKQRKEILTSTKQKPNKTDVVNNLFVGSTAELQKLLSDMKENSNE